MVSIFFSYSADIVGLFDPVSDPVMVNAASSFTKE